MTAKWIFNHIFVGDLKINKYYLISSSESTFQYPPLAGPVRFMTQKNEIQVTERIDALFERIANLIFIAYNTPAISATPLPKFNSRSLSLLGHTIWC